VNKGVNIMRAVRCVTRERSEGKIKRLEASDNIGVTFEMQVPKIKTREGSRGERTDGAEEASRYFEAGSEVGEEEGNGGLGVEV
jgi:hypothetical protein